MSINIDELTLQYFVNKQTYNKYLAKHNPSQYQETKELYTQMKSQNQTIHEIIDHFIDDPESERYDIALRTAFETFMRGLLHHIHHVKQEIHEEEIQEKEEDVLFGSIQEEVIPYWKKYQVRKER